MLCSESQRAFGSTVLAAAVAVQMQRLVVMRHGERADSVGGACMVRTGQVVQACPTEAPSTSGGGAPDPVPLELSAAPKAKPGYPVWDPPLTQNGIDKDTSFGLILVSPFTRCAQTAAALIPHLRLEPGCKAYFHRGLSECFYPKHFFRPADAEPSLRMKLSLWWWLTRRRSVVPGFHTLGPLSVEKKVLGTWPQMSETRRDVHLRYEAAIQDALELAQGRDILIVSHAQAVTWSVWRIKRGYEAAPDFLAHTLSLRPRNLPGLVAPARGVKSAEGPSTPAAAETATVRTSVAGSVNSAVGSSTPAAEGTAAAREGAAGSVGLAEGLFTPAAAGADKAEATERLAVGNVASSAADKGVDASVDDDFPAASPGIGADGGWVLGKVQKSWGISVRKSVWLLNSNGGRGEGGGGGGRPGVAPPGSVGGVEVGIARLGLAAAMSR